MSRELILLIAGQSLTHACMAGMRLAAPLQALRQGYSEVAVGVLIALFALTQVFLALPSGRYADRHGLKRPVRYAVIAAAAGAGLAAIWPIFPVLCVSALLTGGATGSSVIALQRHAGRAAQTPTQLKQVFSWLAIGPAFSNFFGPFIAGLLIDGAGFRAAFLAMALLPIATWLAMRRATELPPVIQPPGERRPRAWDLLRDTTFRRVLLVNWFLSSCWDVHTFVVPVLGHERGFSASVIGTLLGAFAIAAGLIRVVLPMVAAFLREWALIFGAMIATGVLLGIYPLLQTPLAMGLCSVLLGVALGCVQPMVMSMLHQITPEHRHGEAVGLRMMVIQASSVTMPLLFGAAGAAVGVAGVFWAVGVWVLGGSRVAWLLRDDRKS
ncbi:MFS transporter [Ramlibacter sp.]|uniref:MFS transporter n=1 Tax=Ramlibacter sp. TaxID=1917967 RepID=UPI003D0A9DCF